MSKYSFGTPIEDDDILVIQGVEYPLQQLGMRAFRKRMQSTARVAEVAALESAGERSLAYYDLSVDLVVGSVAPEAQEKLREHIERSVGPELLTEIATMIMRNMSDLDPTQPELSPDGSSTTGPDSTDGASPEASTQTD